MPEAVFFLCLLNLAVAGFFPVLWAVIWPAPRIFRLHGQGLAREGPTRSLLSPCAWWLGWNGESRDTKGLRAFEVCMLLTLFR